MELFLGYCGVLNSLPIDAGIKLTLVNRQLNRQEFSQNLLMTYRKDGRDYMRREYNDILLDKQRQQQSGAGEVHHRVRCQAQYRGGSHLLRPRGN